MNIKINNEKKIVSPNIVELYWLIVGSKIKKQTVILIIDFFILILINLE